MSVSGRSRSVLADRGGSGACLPFRQREQPLSIDRVPSLPHTIYHRARIVSRTADGLSSSEVAAPCVIRKPGLRSWRSRLGAKNYCGENATLSRCTLHGEITTMGAYERQGQTPSETVAALRPALITAVEPFEDAGGFRGAHADTGILYRQADLPAIVGQLNLYLSVDCVVFQGIIQRIGDCALQALPVALDESVLRRGKRRCYVFVLCDRLKQFQSITHQPHKIHCRKPEFDGAGFRLGDIQSVVINWRPSDAHSRKNALLAYRRPVHPLSAWL